MGDPPVGEPLQSTALGAADNPHPGRAMFGIDATVALQALQPGRVRSNAGLAPAIDRVVVIPRQQGKQDASTRPRRLCPRISGLKHGDANATIGQRQSGREADDPPADHGNRGAAHESAA